MFTFRRVVGLLIGAAACTAFTGMRSAAALADDGGAQLLSVRRFTFAGAPWAEAVQQVVAGTGIRCEMERDVGADLRTRPVRLTAEYLTGEQVLRWLARMGGVGMLRTGDTCRFGRVEDWPSAWQAQWFNAWYVAGPADEQRRRELDGRRADIEWIDQTLGGAAADIRSSFGIDLVIEPELYARQDLLTFSRRGVSWSALAAAMAERLKAVCVFADGAVALGRREWIMTMGGCADPSLDSRVSESGRAEEGGARPSWWNRRIRLQAKDESWKAALRPMMELMGEEADWRADSAPGVEARRWALEAEGRIGEVLEGLSLLGCLRWRPSAEASGPAVRIETR